MSPSPEQKKRQRPPPLQIPPRPQPRPVPGPNAFAIAEQRGRQAEVNRQREAGNAFYQQAKRSASQTPLASPLEDSHLPRTNSHTSKDKQRGGPMATFVNLVDHARGTSPRKSDSHVSSTTSRHGSTTRSRHSERSQRSQRSGRSSHPLEEDEKTSRGEIEARTEKKFFKMMGQDPTTPTAGTEGPPAAITTYDYSSKSTKKKSDDHAKSPKKKIFGVSLPGFMSPASNMEPVPPMPSKAAQVLGTSLESKRHNPPLPSKTPRSDTSKSLPSKLYDHQSHRRQHHAGSTRSRQRAPVRKTHSPAKAVQFKDVRATGTSGGSSSDLGIPPTPPQKDTPPQKETAPDDRDKLEEVRTHVTHQGAHDEEYESQDELVDGGPTVQVPNFASDAKVIPSNGGESPTKFRPYGAEDYAMLIERQRIGSTYGQVDCADEQQEGNHSAPLEGGHGESLQIPRQERWSEENNSRYRSRLSARLSGRYLPPAFYSPSTYSFNLFDSEGSGRPSKNTDHNRLLFAIPAKTETTSMRNDPDRGSISVVFQGSADEINPSSPLAKMINAAAAQETPPQARHGTGLAPRVRQELQDSEQQESSGSAGGSAYLQPEQSSSRLTDMLGGVSPSKAEYNNEFNPNCPSAVPSPLHQQMRHPMMIGSGPMGNPSSQHEPTLGEHFYMTNEHIDVSGRTLYDFVAGCKHEQLAASKFKHENTVAILEARIEDIKSHFRTEVGRVSEQSHAIDAKLDNLLDFIKLKIVEPLAVQAKRTADMEKDIRALQKSMFDLGQSVETKPNAGLANFPQEGQLPHHRSQPSLAGYYDSPMDSVRDGSSRMPPIPEMRNDNRFRYGNNNGQTWHRPPAVARENSKEETHPLSTANPYHNNGSGPFGGGYMGGYPGYSYHGSPAEQTYGYNQGAPK